METETEKLRPVELWILLILKAGGEVCSKTKIMKILFLLERVYGIIGVKFKPYIFGPWSEDVEHALRRLVELGLVEERELQKPPKGQEHTGLMYLYRNIEKGLSVAVTWSEDVEHALRWVVRLGLVEEMERVYRLTEKGRSVVEKIPLKDPRWRLPYSDVEFFMGWDVRDLMKYIYVNYPEYDVFQELSRIIRRSVIKDKSARKAEV